MTVARVLNTQTLTAALKLQLEQWPQLADERVLVESNTPINLDAGRCPWVGVYQVGQSLPPRALGTTGGFRRHRIQLAVVVTQSSATSGEECEARMEATLSEVLSAILSDPSVRGVVDMIDEQVEVTYSSYRVEGNSYFKEAVVQFAALTTVAVV